MKFLKLDIDQCYAYLVANEDNQAVLIDPKLDYADYYLNLLEEKNLKLSMIIDTHSHADHLSAGTYLREKTNAIYAVHENSAVETANKKLVDGEVFNIGNLNFRVIATPGHTNNSVSIICEDKFFTGDFLFLDGAGRDDLPTGSYEQHFDSIQKIKDLPDHLIVCPGHNYGDNNLASLHQVRKENPVLACNTLEEFIELTKPVVRPDSWMVNVVKLNNAGNTSLEAFEIPKTKSVCQRGASSSKSVDDIPYIKARELNSLLKANKDLLLVDVRTKEELLEIPSLEEAINIPLSELPTRMDEISAYVGKDFVLICKSGARAVRAAKMVKKLNIGKVFVLQGGVVEYTK